MRKKKLPKERWLLHIKRKERQYLGNRERVVGTYKVLHDGKATKISGVTAESPWPGDNSTMGNCRCVETGTYPLATQDGERYKTLKYIDGDLSDYPQPGIELLETGNRKEILIHPGAGFIKSVGCINLAESLPNGYEKMNWAGSRKQVIELIEDMKKFLGKDFPKKDGKPIPGAYVVIEE